MSVESNPPRDLSIFNLQLSYPGEWIVVEVTEVKNNRYVTGIILGHDKDGEVAISQAGDKQPGKIYFMQQLPESPYKAVVDEIDALENI